MTRNGKQSESRDVLANANRPVIGSSTDQVASGDLEDLRHFDSYLYM